MSPGTSKFLKQNKPLLNQVSAEQTHRFFTFFQSFFQDTPDLFIHSIKNVFLEFDNNKALSFDFYAMLLQDELILAAYHGKDELPFQYMIEQIEKKEVKEDIKQAGQVEESNKNIQLLKQFAGLLKLHLYQSADPLAKQINVLNHQINQLNQESGLKNEQIKEIKRQKERIISIISHDLKGMLGNINSISALYLEENQYNHDEIREMLSLIHQSSRHAIDYIVNLRDYSKLDSHQVGLEKTNTSIQDLLSVCVESKSTHAKSLDIKMTYVHEDNIPLIYIDSFRIKQMINHLLENAIKFSQPGQEISIELKNCRQCVKIVISDQGPGMEQEELTLIYEPFYKTKNVPPRHETGSGLGLTIVKQIIDLHQGHIYVTSKKDNGTTFEIVLKVGSD